MVPKPTDVAYWTNPRHLDGKTGDRPSDEKSGACGLADFNCGKGPADDSATAIEELHPHRPNADCAEDSTHVLCRLQLLKSGLKFDLPPNFRDFAPFHHIYLLI